MPNKSSFKTHAEYLQWYVKYREANREKIREYNRKYNKKWRKENGYHNEKKWKKNNPEAIRAQKLLRYAVKKKLIKKQPCAISGCGITKNIQGHHPDYSKPLEVIWCCPKHHKVLEKQKARKKKSLLKTLKNYVAKIWRTSGMESR